MLQTLVLAALLWVGDAVPELPGYELVWAEEFSIDGRPDPTNWGFERGFRRNHELQWYQPENALVRDGMLIIEARRESRPNPGYHPGSQGWRESRPMVEYTSSSLLTRGKHEWLYGIFEMRARIDTRPGMWPAWWTLGSARPWPGCGEIDIMEYYQGKVLANACWLGGSGRWDSKWDAEQTPIDELGGPGWSDEFHVWRMDWNKDRIGLYLDGRLLNEIDVNETVNPDGSNPFREPHYMLVNLAIGGKAGGDPSGTEFPGVYEIDYIRVYQPTSNDSR
ncbi:MAG: glycoside hydrolase family 16 protein [Planctomycetota bacterium]